jgi:hypothetical protein
MHGGAKALTTQAPSANTAGLRDERQPGLRFHRRIVALAGGLHYAAAAVSQPSFGPVLLNSRIFFELPTP